MILLLVLWLSTYVLGGLIAMKSDAVVCKQPTKNIYHNFPGLITCLAAWPVVAVLQLFTKHEIYDRTYRY